MRIDKLITIGALAVTALVTYVCVKRTEETVKERHRELNMIDPHEETSITLGNEELSTDERVKAKAILDDKKNDIYQAVREYWDCRSYFDNKESVTYKDTLRAFIAYEYGKFERRERLWQEAVQKEIASAGKPELKIVNNVTKSDETKETN